VLSILLIAATPLVGGLFGLLLLFQIARGWLEGVIQPVILSVQARAVGRHQQGAVVGLRQTGQRLSSILIPPVMGWVADRCGTSELPHLRRLHAAAVRHARADHARPAPARHRRCAWRMIEGAFAGNCGEAVSRHHSDWPSW
jgi:MFS family permease